MSTDAIEVAVPEGEVPVAKGPGLSSPPDSNDALKLDASDSELSDLEEPEEDIGDVVPDHYADDGRVPVFKPPMSQFKNFQLYMKKVNPYGMKSGIVKVIPPEEWRNAQPSLDEAVKTIKIREPIKQEIMSNGAGSGGSYRQVNILHGRSYNLPQWRQLCEQSEHQPPAKRGERRANPPPAARPPPRTRATAAPASGGSKKKGPGRPFKNKAASATPEKPHTPADTTTKPAEEATAEEATAEEATTAEPTPDRLPTPVSPSLKAEEDLESVKNEADDEGESPVKSGRMGGARQPKAFQSVSSRRKNGRREAAGKIDEAAFKDFKYKLEGDEYTKERCEELERAYWKTLTYASPLYGADMLGTLFDDRTKEWNLGKLENLLDILGTKVPGVNTAYLYLGMWKATFAWHLEDVDLYSINYLHFGAPKQWYSISQGDARRFESAMKSIWGDDAKACDQFLRHKTFLISPSTLLNTYNIKVNKVVHHPGEFVITFPYGYHSGYNLGYNCAEAVNFALDSWLEYGRIAKKCDCAQAQDSVWINVHEIERKLRGEETEEEETEDEEDDDDERPTDLPTPPESSGDSKPKRLHRKRKRLAGDKDGKQIKRIRIRIPSKEPCALCPNDIPSEPLLATDDGRKAHRICALYIPETEIEPGNIEIITGITSIAKARTELKCNYCRSKKGACFQCSQKKCTRAYHATCAAAAGVFVEQGEVPLFGEDGTEYKADGIEFSCRFHRTKRDKKLEGIDLAEDPRILKAGKEATAGQTIQWQPYRGDIYAGTVVENRLDEEMLYVAVQPRGDYIEVDYRWLLLPDAADYHLQKPSANAIPMPKSEKLNTSKRHQDDDVPRPDDTFLPGFIWKSFESHKPDRNSAQVKIDVCKENQIWYYLGKTSTEAKAQFTEDPANPRHNPKGHFLDTIPKLPPSSSAARHSYPASYPARVNQHALNAVGVTSRPPQPQFSSKHQKPYEYKPRVPSSSSSNNYHPEAQGYRPPQNYLPQPTTPYSFGSDPTYRSLPADDRGSTPYTVNPRPSYSHSPTGLMGPPSTFSPSQPQSSSNSPAPQKPSNPFRRPSSSSDQSSSNRPSTAVRYSQRPNPFAKYPYLQKQHNRSPFDYKSPYSPSGGFMNGYEGDLVAMAKQNPEVLFRRSASTTSSTSLNSPSQSVPNPLQTSGYPRKETYVPPPLPLPRSSQFQASWNSHSPPDHSSNYGTTSQTALPPHPATHTATVNAWEKKDSSSLHPAIRQDYGGTMFHQLYQPPTRADQPVNPVQTQAQPRPAHQYSGPQYQPPPAVTSLQYQHQVQQGTAFQLPTPERQAYQPQITQQSSHSPMHYAQAPQSYVTQPQTAGVNITAHPSAVQQAHVAQPQVQQTRILPPKAPQPAQQQAQASHPPLHQLHQPMPSQDNKPLYAHQQYFQKAPAQQQSHEHGPREIPDVPDVPADSTDFLDKMMANLRRASAGA